MSVFSLFLSSLYAARETAHLYCMASIHVDLLSHLTADSSEESLTILTSADSVLIRP